MADVDPMRIRSSSSGHAVFRIIDSVNFSGTRQRCELVNRPAAATTDIKNLVVRLDRDMTQSPIGQLRVMPIHVPQNEPAEQPRRFPALRDYFVDLAHGLRTSTRRISPL